MKKTFYIFLLSMWVAIVAGKLINMAEVYYAENRQQIEKQGGPSIWQFYGYFKSRSPHNT